MNAAGWSERFASVHSALCVGLDPVPERLPEGVSLDAFLDGVIEVAAPHACCFKPNIAFFERLGLPGLASFARVLGRVRERGLPLIIDAKRGDIGSTAEAYADAYLGGPFDGDALTVNPSVGLDAIEPFRKRAKEKGRGLFLLLRTSNPGAARFQQHWEADLVAAIREEPAFGAVVGATDAATGARLRAALPETLFLVPGFGAQGGARLADFFRPNGGGAVVNSSRAILYPEAAGRHWKDAVEAAAKEAKGAIQEARAKSG